MRQVAAADGYRLYLNMPDRWARFADGNGIVVGDLFVRSGTQDMGAASGGSRATRADGFDALLRHYWGGYVAFRSAGPDIELLRDPSGALPVYRVDRGEGCYIASDVPLLVQLGLYRPEIDWDTVGWFFYTNGLPGARTALAGLAQITPGMAVTVAAHRSAARLCWSPWSHVGASDQGPEALRNATIGCVRAWQARYRSVLVGVSGGLDSSIVASSLERVAVSAVTISTGDAHGDEAAYAETLCAALGVPLGRARYAHDAVDIMLPSLPHRPVPGGMAQLQAYDAVVIDAARQSGAAAFVSGLGGDNVFHLTHSARPLVDRVLAQGPTFGSFRTLSDLCRLTGASRMTMLRAAMRVPRRAGAKYRWPTDRRLLDPAAIESFAGRPLGHPWLDAPPSCLPGQHAHVATIVRAHAYLECHDRRWPIASIHPLMSQPIIELALATPSWVACEGGVDRARARRAFATDIPPAVLQRRLKGGPDGFALKILRTQLPAVRDILMDGQLVRNGVVDRNALDQALTEPSLMRGQDYTRLLQFLDTEAWANQWQAIAASTARASVASPPSAPPRRDAVGHPGVDREARS
ncbi:asparagine synthase-related protein [Sphingomonas oryzagri]